MNDHRRNHWTRMRSRSCAILLAALALPLVATGPCLLIAEQSLIEGFFVATTPYLIDRVADDLGVVPASQSNDNSSAGNAATLGTAP